MTRTTTLALLSVLVAVSASRAAILEGRFIPLLLNQSSTNYSGAPGLFDTWAFQVRSDQNWDSLGLDFTSAGKFINDNDAINGTGDFTFKAKAADGSVTNPGPAANRIPETFMAIPNGTTPLGVNIIDTANELRADFAVNPFAIQVPNTNVFTTVAMFSVPAGTVLDRSNFARGDAVFNGGPINSITYVPEPATLPLFGLAAVAACNYIRRRKYRAASSL